MRGTDTRRGPNAALAVAVAAWALLQAAGLGCGRAEDPRRPNVVFLLADDVGIGDLGSYGGDVIRTPHLDRLASEGMRFRSFYATPVCGPSRFGILTGRYTRSFDWRGPIIRDPERTLAALFQQAGYTTALIGKWHGLAEIPDSLPTRRGFDRFYGYLMGHNNSPAVWREERVIEEKSPRADRTLRETEQALAFLRDVGGRPFFLLLSYTAGHNPPFASAGFRGRSASGLRGDMLEELDWSVGEVLGALAELGLEEDTIVLFTSDNPGTAPHSSGSLRGEKGSLYEGGIRVPLLVRWPGRIEAGSVEERPGHLVDWLPTLARMGDLELPRGRVDGRDLTGVLLGTGTRADEDFYWGIYAHRSGPWKLVVDPDGNEESDGLFDVDADPLETSDLAGAHPETLERLRRQLRDFWRGVDRRAGRP